MFRHLLVPLDGSRLAETALPVSAVLADRLGASVTLIHVMERDAPAAVHGDRHLTSVAAAEAYLAEVAARAFAPGTQVAQHVHTEPEGDVAGSIGSHAFELASDLIVMCPHGRGGLRHRIFGSHAPRVVRSGTPVLLVPPPPAGGTRAFACGRRLVTLSGREENEGVLSVAGNLARACGATLHLLVVVPTLGTLTGEPATLRYLLPGTTAELLELEEADWRTSLDQHLASLQASGLEATGEVARGDPAAVILERARSLQPDVIVAGTHGKTGIEAFWSGSVAPRVAQQTETPLLLVSAGAPASGA